MILHRIRLENYRGIGRSEIALGARGITLVEGPNEVGKSSLAEALGILIRYPDSSKHRDVEAVLPTHRDAGPEVEVELETGRYRLVYRKRFRKRPETELRVLAPRPESLTGREAHDRMDAILAETLDRPLFDALQVVQGERIDQPRLTDSAALRRALDAAAGGGAGDDDGALFARVDAEYLRYWTPTGQPHKDRRTQDALVGEIGANVADLERRQRELEGAVREHERRSAQLSELRRRLPDLERAAAASGKEKQALEDLRWRIRSAGEVARRAAAEAELAEGNRGKRMALVEEIVERSRALDALRGEQATAGGRALEQARDAEAQRAAQAQERKREATAAAALAQLRAGDHQLFQDELQRDQLAERRERLESLEARASAARETMERIRVDAAALERLRQAEVAVATARSLLDAAGVRLGLRARAPVAIELAGEPSRLDAGATREVTLTERATLVVGDQLEVTVEPGRGLGERRAGLEEAEAARDALLRSFGVESLAAAVAAEADLREARGVLGGIEMQRRTDLRDLRFDELVAKHERQKERVERYRASRPAEPPLPSSLEEARRAKEDADVAVAEARARLEAADSDHDVAKQSRSELEAAERERASKLNLLATQLAESQHRLAEAREATADTALEAAAADAAEAHTTSNRALGSLEASLAEKNPDAIDARAASDAGALERARTDQRELENALAGLAGQLRGEGESGLGEQLERERARLEHAREERARLERRARAAERLFTELRDARDAARRAWVAPLAERIERLGRVVYGDAFSVALDDDLAIVSRTLDGVTVPFTSLSTGAREQLGILVRLAAALTVAEDGGVPVVLDDTLGNTDPERLHAMCAVLGRVAEACQILLLTCYPDRFRALGDVRVVRLAGA